MLTGPMEFAPYRPWTAERRAAARARVRHGSFWVGERPAIATRMWRDGATLKAISEYLSGVSRSGVASFIRRSGLTRNKAIVVSHDARPMWTTPEITETDYRLYFRVGTRVKVNETYSYGLLGKAGTVRRVASGRHKWLGVEFDDNEIPGHVAKWHRGYFDPV